MNDFVVLSPKARKEISEELERFYELETGGVLLGMQIGKVWYITHSISPDHQAIRTSTSFEYNGAELECRVWPIIAKSNGRVRLLGLWHRHTNMHDPCFSSADKNVNEEFAKVCGGKAVSILVQTKKAKKRVSAFLVREKFNERKIFII